MRILQINASYKPAYVYGGPTMSVSKLSEQLLQAGCEVQVYTTTANGKLELTPHQQTPVNIDGVPVLYFERLTKDHSHFSPQLLRSVWNNARNFDIVHVHAWWNMVSVLSTLVALIKGIPVVVSPRGTLSLYSFHNKNAFIKKCIHFFLGKPLLKRSAVHATSQHEKENLQQIIKPKQTCVIPNFIQLPQSIPARDGDDPGILKLIFFSRIEEKKGLDILLNALPMVNIPYHLTIAGDGAMAYIEILKQLAIKNKVSENIDWIGFQSDNKFDILARHHLLVLPSHDENFGNVVIESLSVGTAVLISRHVGLATYVSEHDLGWICNNNAGALAGAINNISLDELNMIGITAPGIITNDFNESTLVKKYIDMYQQIIQNGRL